MAFDRISHFLKVNKQTNTSRQDIRLPQLVGLDNGIKKTKITSEILQPVIEQQPKK